MTDTPAAAAAPTNLSPAIADLVWQDVANEPGARCASFTPEWNFIRHYFGLPEGMTERWVDVDTVQDGEAVREKFMCVVIEADADVASVEKWCNDTPRRLAIHEAKLKGKYSAEAAEGVCARAREMLAKWGEFSHKGDRVREILSYEWITPRELKELDRLIGATNANAAAKRIEVRDRREQPDVELTDLEVVRAVAVLTQLGRDHAQEANKQGWGKSTSAAGHWCYAMMATDEALAIKEGRRLIAVGKHIAQLQRLGVVERRAA